LGLVGQQIQQAVIVYLRLFQRHQAEVQAVRDRLVRAATVRQVVVVLLESLTLRVELELVDKVTQVAQVQIILMVAVAVAVAQVLLELLLRFRVLHQVMVVQERQAA
jgi:hypothetical protein